MRVPAALGLAAAGWLSGCGPPVRWLIYPVPPIAVPRAPAPLEEVALQAGEPVVAWHLRGEGAGRPLVLWFHGNAENLETLRQSGLFGEVARLGADLLAVDYPGYGRSAGEPSEAANLAAGEAALAWAAVQSAQSGGARPVVVCGWSLGAAVAIQLAARHPEQVDRLVLMSAWTSLRDVAREHYPAFLVGVLLSERYDSLAAAREVRCPVLVLHGAEDDIISTRHGEALARALGDRARFVAIPGAGHNDLLGEARVWEELGGFLAR